MHASISTDMHTLKARRDARAVCSVLVLASCDGFAADTYKMWCCTATSCDIVFTQSEVDDLGIGGDDPLEHIPCITAAASTRGFTP